MTTARTACQKNRSDIEKRCFKFKPHNDRDNRVGTITHLMFQNDRKPDCGSSNFYPPDYRRNLFFRIDVKGYGRGKGIANSDFGCLRIRFEAERLNATAENKLRTANGTNMPPLLNARME